MQTQNQTLILKIFVLLLFLAFHTYYKYAAHTLCTLITFHSSFCWDIDFKMVFNEISSVAKWKHSWLLYSYFCLLILFFIWHIWARIDLVHSKRNLIKYHSVFEIEWRGKKKINLIYWSRKFSWVTNCLRFQEMWDIKARWHKQLHSAYQRSKIRNEKYEDKPNCDSFFTWNAYFMLLMW